MSLWLSPVRRQSQLGCSLFGKSPGREYGPGAQLWLQRWMEPKWRYHVGVQDDEPSMGENCPSRDPPSHKNPPPPTKGLCGGSREAVGSHGFFGGDFAQSALVCG